MIIFRWSVWGQQYDIFMLSQSIGTFQRFFGDDARYIVYTDSHEYVTLRLQVRAEIYQFSQNLNQQYLEEGTPWKKWTPSCRLDTNYTEIKVDADIFLLADPIEIKVFCAAENNKRFLTTVESFHALWPYGNFGPLLPVDFTPINSGMIGQARGADLSADLAKQYHWWKTQISTEKAKFHDEQGALSLALQEYIQRDEVVLLSPERYRIVSPKTPLDDPSDIDKLVMMHATYPHHPAFHQFLPKIREISNI